MKYIYNDQRLDMSNIKFAVQPAGHAKVIREQKKNVHAFVRGTYEGQPHRANQARVSYNPYIHDHFFTSFGGNTSPIYKARRASLSGGKVYVNP